MQAQDSPPRGTLLARRLALSTVSKGAAKGIYFKPYADGKGGTLDPAPPYEVAYRDSTGKTRFETVASVADAKARLAEVTFGKSSGKRVVRSTKTYNEAHAEWLSPTRPRARAIAESTRRVRERTHKHYIAPVIGDRKLRDIGQEDMLRVIRKANECGLDGSSAALVRRQMNAVFRYSIKMDWTGFNPVDRTDKDDWPARGVKEDMAKLILTPAQAAGLFSVCSGWFLVFIRLAFATGMRSAELRGLRWKDVHFDDNRILLSGQMEDGFGWKNQLKSRPPGATRDVVLHPGMTQALKDWRVECMAKGTHGADSYVFTTRTGRALCSTQVFRAWSAALVKCGLRHRKLHITRHTFASWMVAEGKGIQSVADALGDSIEVATRTYVHLYDKDRTAVDVVDTIGKAMNL